MVAALLAAVVLSGCGLLSVSPSAPSSAAVVPSIDASADRTLAELFDQHRSGVQVTGAGTITRILADDDEGSRHQRFIVLLASGQTLLIAHNIDVAPRVEPLAVGDRVEFSGIYEWNSEGGLVHWTHHDPDGVHPPGWIEHDGTIFQ
jgi:hypothetical protein